MCEEREDVALSKDVLWTFIHMSQQGVDRVDTVGFPSTSYGHSSSKPATTRYHRHMHRLYTLWGG